MPAAPISGFILPPLRKHISLPSNTPQAVSRIIATRPRANTLRVISRTKVSPDIVAPMLIPSRSVTMLASSFWAVLLSRATTPHSLRKLPSISMPIRGAPLGASRDTKMVTIIGNRILTTGRTDIFDTPILIIRSFLVVSIRITGGWISGTSDI